MKERKIRAKILGTDIDSTAINTAKTGEYEKWKTNKIEKKILEKYFNKKENDTYKICDEIYEKVEFIGSCT